MFPPHISQVKQGSLPPEPLPATRESADETQDLHAHGLQYTLHEKVRDTWVGQYCTMSVTGKAAVEMHRGYSWYIQHNHTGNFSNRVRVGLNDVGCILGFRITPCNHIGNFSSRVWVGLNDGCILGFRITPLY